MTEIFTIFLELKKSKMKASADSVTVPQHKGSKYKLMEYLLIVPVASW